MTTLLSVELGVLGPLQVRKDGAPVAIPGAKPRAILTMLGLHSGSVVSAASLVDLLWDADQPRTADKALQTHISSLRRTLGDGVVLTAGAGWTLAGADVDAERYKSAAKAGRDAAAAGDASQAAACFEEALTLWRGIPELPDSQRGVSEKTRWIEGHAALVEDRADALLATGRAAEIVGELEAAVAEAPLRERRWGQLMLALYRAGRQGEALGAYRRARSLLADELGVDPGPELRRLEAAIVAQDAALDTPGSQQVSSITRAVTFLLTDIEGSTAAWEADHKAMAVALARHDEIVEQVVTSRGGRLIKTRGEGDATFSVFERPSAAAAAAIELQDAIIHEPWALREPMRVRVALHTGEVELRDGDYFGRAVNRVARLRSLAAGGQILCSGATAELVIDSLPDDVLLADLGMRQLKNLARPEHVFELRVETQEPQEQPGDPPIERPAMPTVLAGSGPFVGRGRELARLSATWQDTLASGTRAVLIAGEPGVGKTRLAGEWSRQAYDQGAVVLYGRCDEDLGAPYQPFAEALRSLVPCLGASRLRGLRGVEALLPLVPVLSDVVPDLTAPARADPDTERYALFDAVVALLEVASAGAHVVLVLDDLHWAAKPTLLLLRHLLRFGEHARVQIVGTYRSTDLDRSHPLAAMLADLHRDGTANRISLGGLDEDDVTTYVAEAGYDDEELARALASVTGGNPFFLIEALRHVDESGGVWDPSTLPQGVREAVSRRLSRLPVETNKALAAAAVVGSRFALDLVERVVDDDLIDAFDEAAKAGIVIEEPGGYYRFNHAIVRQSLLTELASVRRMRLHQRIAATLETQPGADDELLAELAYHYFECAWAGNASKAVHYCRRAADQAMARLAYEGAAELYDRALHALEELDEELPDREDLTAELLVARCEALLAAGDVTSAAGAVSQLQEAAGDSERLEAWATCFDGQLTMLVHPERLDEVEAALGAAADKLAELGDAAGEAKAHTERAACLGRLGRVADCEIALDNALTAARRAHEHRRVNAVLAGAPLAALWGPNPVPRAGGRCLDVVRLLRITTDSPAVEATSTRCQAVLEAFRGRTAAAQRMIDSARRTVTELGLRHALLEVEQFAGIVELVADDAAAAEPHLRKAHSGFRRMGLDADTAETAALLARACLALGREDEADEFCSESERLAGHALKAAIAWRTVRAQLLARRGEHAQARRVAEAAVAMAERTDALVDHGDACLALATVLNAAGDLAGARATAEHAVDLYERKGAAALVDGARRLLGGHVSAALPAAPRPAPRLDNACVRVLRQIAAVFDRGAWDEYEALYASDVFVESRRKIVGFTRADLPSGDWPREARRLSEMSGGVRHELVAVRGERFALIRLDVGTEDPSPGAPQDQFLGIFGIDTEGRIALQVFFDLEDIDAALAELDAIYSRFEAHTVALDNACVRALRQFDSAVEGGAWNAFGQVLAPHFAVESRRKIVGFTRRPFEPNELAAYAKQLRREGLKLNRRVVIATRGDRLALTKVEIGTEGDRPGAPREEVLHVVTLDEKGLIALQVWFDVDDIDAAFEELDARYLADEAAPYARVWQSAMELVGEMNRHQPGPMMTGLKYIDHRRVPFAPGDYGRAIEQLWSLVPDARYRLTTVQALDAHGTVGSLVIVGSDAHGNQLQWARTFMLAPDRPQLEIYDEGDVDAAVTRFEELRSGSWYLENEASHAAKRFFAHIAARDWEAVTDILAEDFAQDDRRVVVGAGVRHGRAAEIADLQGIAELSITDLTSSVVAVRGRRLALMRVRFSFRDSGAEAFVVELLGIVETDADHRISAGIVFDLDDFDAALAELDARYLAGEAALYARTWSVIASGYSAFNRGQGLQTTQDWVNIDHRRGVAVAPGEVTEYVRAAWDLEQDISIYIERVHRLNELGAVITHATRAISREGLDAEWRFIVLATVDGELVNRCELFDEADLDAAIATFERLSRPLPRLKNIATEVDQRFWTSFRARDWDVMAQTLSHDFSLDDRRQSVNAGLRHGRHTEIENLKAIADMIGDGHITSTVIATRGKRLALRRLRFLEQDQAPQAFYNELIGVVEINADNQLSAHIAFDPDDIHAALAELDARYLAGEAAPYARTWSAVRTGYAAVNRREPFATTPNWVNVDHRRGIALTPGEMVENMRAQWDLAPHISYYVEAVHRLNDWGTVATRAANGRSRQGFNAEWRVIDLLTFEGDMVSRCETFDEADLQAALAHFDQLQAPRARFDNAASRVTERYWANFAARNWDAIAGMMADDFASDDRRRMVGAGVRHGRDAEIADLRAIADLGLTTVASTIIATRGQSLILGHARFSGPADWPETAVTEILGVIEIDADERITATVVFDPHDIDAAFEELDARYLGGEAAAYSGTWSVIMRAYGALNRRELPPTTPDWVDIDRRRLVSIEAGGMKAYLRHTWSATSQVSIHVKAVHRLNDLGAVVTHSSSATSREGLEAEWEDVSLLTVEGDLISCCELFDEADLRAALARFDELCPPARRPENAATRTYERVKACFAARDWDALAEMLAADISTEDRRRVVNAGVRHGRDAALADIRAYTQIGAKAVALEFIATRGDRLVLTRGRPMGRDGGPEAFSSDVLDVIETDADGRIVARIIFDPDDFDSATTELEARYLAGEAAMYARTWSVIAGALAAVHRREVPPTAPDWVNVDHRRTVAVAHGDVIGYMRENFSAYRSFTMYSETVHRLTHLGAVVTWASRATSHDGFDAEWRGVFLLTLDGDRVSRIEIFDEADLEDAISTFEQLSRPVSRLHNAASQLVERFQALFTVRDWKAIEQLVADDIATEDRRRVVNGGVMRGRDVEMANVRTIAELGGEKMTSTVIATRGDRLVLARTAFSSRDWPDSFEIVDVVEVNSDNQLCGHVLFDPNDIDAAFEELDTRYLAGEAARYARTWSVITQVRAGLSRHELPATTPDWANVDHRRVAGIEAGDLTSYIRAVFDDTPDISVCVEAVHRLSNRGALYTLVARGTSHEGFDAEWRGVDILMVEGDLVSRCERFDEEDFDAALARFNELHAEPRRLENVASRTWGRLTACFAVRDWAAMAATLADDLCTDDRRRVVNAGIRQGRDINIADTMAVADVGVTDIPAGVIATRGERLALLRSRLSGRDPRPEAYHDEVFHVVEVNADDLIATVVVFDGDDVDAAFAELDARYLAGEAAGHSQMWSVATEAYTALNRHELPPMSDWVTVDHRVRETFEGGDLTAYTRAMWDIAPDIKMYIEAVHRLSDRGAVVTHVAYGSSDEGFEAEWRMVAVLTFGRDHINRCELFDDEDLDAALARFDELNSQSPLLENAATRVWRRAVDAINRRDMDNALADAAGDARYEDRRKGLQDEGLMRAEVVRALFEARQDWLLETEPVAIRGNRLALTRDRFRDTVDPQRPITIEHLTLLELNENNCGRWLVLFDPDDINSAMAELTASWIASGEVAHPDVIQTVQRLSEVSNRHDWGAVAANLAGATYMSHRQLAHVRSDATDDYLSSIEALASLLPDFRAEFAEILDYSSNGLVARVTVKGTSNDGSEIEIPLIQLGLLDGERVTRIEFFDPDQREQALARFEELNG